MNHQEVDARVQAAVENLQAGRTVEDDTGMEFKSDWPDPAEKARQLAGAANAMHGGQLIYVIGVHDKSGAITVPAKTEPQEWYAQICKPFDQVAPELLRSQTVYVGKSSESVVALVFDTSQYPYVINVAEANRREIPIRVGSGTESARRNQLVRMFQPSLRPPAMSIAHADVEAEWEDAPKTEVGKERETGRVLELTVSIRAHVLVEHFGLQPTTMPVRDMRLRLTAAGYEARPEVSVRHLGNPGVRAFRTLHDSAPPEPIPPQYGVYARENYVIATAPGDFTVMATTDVLRREAPNSAVDELSGLLSHTDEMQLDLAVRVVGVANLVKLSCPLRRATAPSATSRRHPSGKGDVRTTRLGTWKSPGVDRDPWS